MTTGARADRPNLSRDFADLLVEFSTAVHKHSMYPAGHPALGDVAMAVVDRASKLFGDRNQIAIGVARHQLVVDGVATAPEHPVLARLADCLHQHQLGALTLHAGLDPNEVEAVLRVLSSEAEIRSPLGLRPPAELPSWRTVQLHPLTFDNLSLVEAGSDPAEGGSRWHGAELWLGLAQAALAGQTTAGGDAPIETDPTALARAIDAHRGAQAYDQVVVGYLLQIAQALGAAPTADAEALRARTSGLIGALQPETLRRLVGASRVEARTGFVRNAVRTLGVGAVVDVLKATADVNGESISDGLTRILSKLAAQATAGQPVARVAADEALREQVSRLLVDWDLEDPNPESYGRLLAELSTSSQRGDDAASPEAALDGNIRIAEMALELGEVGPLATRSIARAIASGNLRPLMELMDHLPEQGGPVADDLRHRLLAPEVLSRIVEREPVDFDLLDRLLPWMTSDGYAVLLQALADSSHRATRRRLLDRIASAPIDLTDAIASRLDDPRWYVQRNMLHLIERTGQRPEGFTVAPWLSHEDWHVRIEAVRIALRAPADYEAGVRAALGDPQARVVALGLWALGESCPAPLTPLVVAVARNPGVPEASRVQALRALAHSTQPQALAALIGIVDGGRTFFGRSRLAAPDAICLAALRALAEGFGASEQARPFLALAESSPIEAVRAAVVRR